MTIIATVAFLFLLLAAQGIYRNWGKPTFDALPSNIDEPSEWVGKDHDKVWYTRRVKYVKGWFAVGPFSNYRWAQWRRVPKLLFAIRGKGAWRFEQDGPFEFVEANEDAVMTWKEPMGSELYLSRVQYYCRWHFAVQWPLQLTFHVYWKAKDVPEYPNRPGDLGLSKLLYMYGPTHRDADMVYWLMSFFLGGEWK